MVGNLDRNASSKYPQQIKYVIFTSCSFLYNSLFFFFLLSFIFACDGLCDCEMRFASPTYKKWLTRQRNLSSSEVRASALEHGVSWVRIPSGAQIFFCVLLRLILYISLYFLYNINISGIGELPINLNFSFRFIFLRHLQRLTYFDDLDMEDNRRLSFFHVVPNSTFRMKFWPQWVSLIQASYHGDLKGMYYSRIIKRFIPLQHEVLNSEINKIYSGAVHVRNRAYCFFFSFFLSGFLTGGGILPYMGYLGIYVPLWRVWFSSSLL